MGMATTLKHPQAAQMPPRLIGKNAPEVTLS
jgi:hypothetical protein